MARRVYVDGSIIKSSFPGFDAATANLAGTSFSSAAAALSGSVSGPIYFPAASSANPQTMSILLPPGTGVPIVWVWNGAPGEDANAFKGGNVLFEFNPALTHLVVTSRDPRATWAEYLIYRNRT
jgi:hypothetical protein